MVLTLEALGTMLRKARNIFVLKLGLVYSEGDILPMSCLYKSTFYVLTYFHSSNVLAEIRTCNSQLTFCC